MEELLYAEEGELLTDTLSTYKVPDIHSAPAHIDVHFMQDAGSELGLLGGKAIGEPPFMYGIGVFFAIIKAMKAFRPGLRAELCSPLTPERVLMTLHGAEQAIQR
jgi:xanthine dehydrogenase large subunit